MAIKLDVEQIERSRRSAEKKHGRGAEKLRIREAIEQNRNGQRKGVVIMPQRKLYAYQDAKKIRVAAYCRVSTAEEAQAGSFEMQVQHFTSIIEGNPAYELVKIYTDEGISGTSIHRREGFLAMIEDAKAGRIDLILTKSISRFGRNIVDVLSTLRELDSLSPPVAVVFESQGINTGDGNKLIISILSALAEMESMQKSIAIKEGIRYRMQEGIYRFSVRNTLGYYRDYAGHLKVDRQEAEIVKFIYDAFINGNTLKSIADSLTEIGIHSPMGMDKWSSQTIRSILRNEKYCGDVLYQKSYSKDYLSHKAIKNRNILPQWFWENEHEAIISRNLWQTVQKRLDASSRLDRTPTFEYVKSKSGALKDYYLLDMQWTHDELEHFIETVLQRKDKKES